MPSIGIANMAAVELLPEKAELRREPYLDMVKAIAADKQPRQLTPGEDETLRKLKVNVTRAATELGVRISQRVTRDGNLVVYLKPDPKAKKSANGSAVASAEPEADEEDEDENTIEDPDEEEDEDEE